MPPFIGDGDSLLLNAIFGSFEANFVRMCNHGGHSSFVDGVENIEEVGTIRKLAFRELGRKVDGDVWVVFELRVKVGD